MDLDLHDRRGIVTGAGSAIGRPLAVELGRRGGRLLLVDRRSELLTETAELVAAVGGDPRV
jgi:NAD(P)-dependent dehydrogenase (short-subunit alcohol dehydrogenase family)